MGLDMYLYARKVEYISSYFKGKMSLDYPKDLVKYFTEFDPANIADYDDRSISRTTDYKIGYWRKANHIHAWFVHHCGHDIDECQEISVSEKALDELLKVCKTVLEDHSKAEELLPTQSGFFFGGVSYDKYYFEEVEKTVSIIEKTLGFLVSQDHKKTDWEIVYRASW